MPSRNHIFIIVGVGLLILSAPLSVLAKFNDRKIEDNLADVQGEAVGTSLSENELISLGCIKGDPPIKKQVNNGPLNFSGVDQWSEIVEVPSDSWHVRPLAAPRDEFGIYYFCPVELIGGPDAEIPVFEIVEAKGWEKQVIEIISLMITISANIGAWLLNISGKLFAIVLEQNEFITQDFVRQGWPFIQGLANLGFIVSLLYIAIATTLRIQSFNVFRMLPRLLLAALLINFSLIIGGVIIDLSRVVMAILLRLMVNSDLTDMAFNIMNNSGLLSELFNTSKGSNTFGVNPDVPRTWMLPFAMARGAILIWGLGVGFFVIAVFMLIRYIALLLLLIASPFAYVGFVLPGAEKYASAWWSNFLKWTFYGPIALFILLLLVKVNGSVQLLSGDNSFVAGIVQIFITIAMLMVAATAGRKFAAFGSDTATNFLGNVKNQVRRHPYIAGTAAAVAGGGLPGLATVAAVGGALYGAKQAKRQAGDAWDVTKSRIRDAAKDTPLLKPFVPAKRDEKGKLKPGEESFAKKYAEKITGPQGKKKTQARAAVALAPITAANINNPAIAAPMLSKGHVTAALGKPQVINVVNYGDAAQVKSLLKNLDYLRSLDDNERTQLQLAIQMKGVAPGTTAITNQDKSRAVERLLDAFDKIDNV